MGNSQIAQPVRDARKSLDHFLKHPHYPIKGMSGFQKGDPWSLYAVMGNHDVDMNNGKGGKKLQRGTAAIMYRAIAKRRYTEKDALDALPEFSRRWRAYRRSKGP